MLLHTCTNILVKKLFGNDLVRRFSHLSLTIWGVSVLFYSLQYANACLFLFFFVFFLSTRCLSLLNGQVDIRMRNLPDSSPHDQPSVPRKTSNSH